MTDLSAYIQRLERNLSSAGYTVMDVPMLEETDLYLRKSGSQVITRLYSLTDPGGRRLSLRPEFTASIIKAYIDRFQGDCLPLRWQYSGPVFRYGTPGPFGQFHQIGAEMIGAPGHKADAEVLAAACQGLEELGLREYTVVIGHAGLLPGLLEELHLSERSKTLILGNLQSFKEGPEEVAQLKERLKYSATADGEPVNEAAGTGGVNDEETLTIFRKLLKDGWQRQAGSRTAEEIVARFREKLMAQIGEEVDRALSIAGGLAVILDTRGPALRAAKKIIEHHKLSQRSVDELERVLDTAESSYGLHGPSVLLDFGLVRGLAYYTGPIFELFPGRGLASQAVCGGGRYDGLVRALGGGEDVPALGFAYNVERLTDAIEGQGREVTMTGTKNDSILIIPASDKEHSRAVSEAHSRRARGQSALVEVVDRPVEKSLEYAAAHGIHAAMVVGEAGTIQEYIITRGEWTRVASSPAQ